MDTVEDVEQLRRSVVMLTPGVPAFDREQALEVLTALRDSMDEVRQLRRLLRG